MIAKEDLINLLKKENATTLKALRAFPTDQSTFKPHERSSDAITLTSTLVFGCDLVLGLILGGTFDPSIFKTYRPESVAKVTEDFDQKSEKVIRGLEKLPESEWKKTIEFAGNKFVTDDFLVMLMHDQIHHRGQLTVYIRMAGGKVPSIYGPSADDKTTNL